MTKTTQQLDLQHLYIVILCGGGGTRLWPLSRQATPKQFINLIGAENLFIKTLRRAQSIVANDHIYIMTNKDYLTNIKHDAPEIPTHHIIAEPAKKNTALAMGVVAGIIHQQDNQAVIINLASDHLINNLAGFKKTVLASATIASQQEYFVTVGIEPTFAHTGYGYIKADHQLETVDSLPIFKVDGFREKPNFKTATKYIKTGKYYWNANLYTWSTKLILKEFQLHAPKLYQHIKTIQTSLNQPDFEKIFRAEYLSAQEEAIDTAISEKTSQLLVIPGDFGWTDIGSWDVVHDETPHDKQGNALVSRDNQAQWLKYNTHNSLVSVAHKTIVTIGLDEVVIVDTDDALLIMKKDQAQKVKKVIKDLKQTSQTNLL